MFLVSLFAWTLHPSLSLTLAPLSPFPALFIYHFPDYMVSTLTTFCIPFGTFISSIGCDVSFMCSVNEGFHRKTG